MKRHIAGLFCCFCMIMQLSAYPDRMYQRGFPHSDAEGNMPIVYPGWKDKLASETPSRTPKPAKVPVQPSMLPDLPDETDGEIGDRAHIVYNKGGEKDGTSITIDLEPQETKELLNAVSPAIKIGGVVLGVAGVCIAIYYGSTIKAWWNKK